MGRTSSHRERGAVTVEFVLVLPLFLMLIFGLLSYGIMLSFRGTLSQAATEGARAGAVAPSVTSDTVRLTSARTAITTAFANGIGGSLTCNSSGTLTNSGGTSVGTCTVTKVTCDGNQCISVVLQYNYRTYPRVTVPQFGMLLPQSLTYTASARIS